MGRFGIVIVGVGPHHNADNRTDADKMAHQFVNKLREAGHTVEVAQIEIEGGAGPEALQHDVDLRPPFFGTAPSAPPANVQVPAANELKTEGTAAAASAPAAPAASEMSADEAGELSK
jgi:hypothetical protein